MIARIWHGAVPAHKAAAYRELMRTVAIPDYRAIPGNKTALVLERPDGDKVHFVMLTLWDSMTSVIAFAGEPPERAKYYDFDAGYLLELEPTVQHFEVFDEGDLPSI